MASKQQRITVANFKGLNSGTQPHLIEQNEFSVMRNSRIVDGEVIGNNPVCAITGADYTTVLGSYDKLYLFQRVYYADSWATSRFQNSAYLAVTEDTTRILLVNPNDLTESTFVTPVFRLETPTTSNAAAAECLVTGWDSDGCGLFTNDVFRIKKGSTGTTFVFSDDNGATWSTDKTVSTTGTNITTPADSKNLTVYFQTTDITDIGTDEWKWTSAGTSAGTDETKNLLSSFCWFDKDLIFTWQGLIMVFDGRACFELGYKRHRGHIVRNFFDHLMIGRYNTNDSSLAVTFARSTSGFEGYGELAGDNPFTLAWSDLNDYHDFLATNANEADVYLFPAERNVVGSNYGIQAMEVWSDALFIFTNNKCYRMDYIGLPLVMRVSDLSRGASCYNLGSSCITPNGIALIDGNRNFVLFNGQTTENIGESFIEEISTANNNALALNSTLVSGNFQDTAYPYAGFVNMFFDPYDQAVVFLYTDHDSTTTDRCDELRYNFEQGAGHQSLYSQAHNFAKNTIYTYVRDYTDTDVKLYFIEGKFYTNYDANSSYTLGTPHATDEHVILETGDIFYNNMLDVVTVSTIFPNATWGSALSVDYQIYYSVRDKLEDAVTYTALVDSADEPTRPIPIRKGGRIWRFKIQTDSTQYTIDFKLHSLIFQVNGLNRNVEN